MPAVSAAIFAILAESAAIFAISAESMFVINGFAVSATAFMSTTVSSGTLSITTVSLLSSLWEKRKPCTSAMTNTMTNSSRNRRVFLLTGAKVTLLMKNEE